MECLLEEMQIKLSIVVSDLLGASGLRMLQALAKAETDPKKLAQSGRPREQEPAEVRSVGFAGRVIACKKSNTVQN